jgi:hypothetical protein
MNINGLDKAEVLAALYNGSHQLGMGVLDGRGANNMTIEKAREILDASESKYFDYLHGRVMKIDLRDDDMETALYNRDNGQGAAERAIALLTTKAA